MSLETIDRKRKGLLPWLYEEHKAYVIGKHGSIKATHPKDAESYIDVYKKKEEEDDASYEKQKLFLENVSKQNPLAPPQVFPERVKLDWVPEEEVKKKKEKKELTPEEFGKLPAPRQKTLLKKLEIKGDVSTEEERVALYKDSLSA